MTKLQYPDHNQKMLMDPHDNLWGTSNYVQNMVTSSNGIIFRVTGPSCGEFTGHRSQRPVTWSFDAFFDLRLNTPVVWDFIAPIMTSL